MTDNASSSRPQNVRHRVLFFQSNLAGGGAERTLLNVINGLDRERFQPLLVLNKAEGPYLSALHDDVEVVEVGASRLRNSLPGLVRQIRRFRPDLCFATLHGPSVVLWLAAMAARSKVPLILRESNNHTAMGTSSRSLGGRLVGAAFRRAYKVVCLSDGVNADVRKRYSGVEATTIYNPIDLAGIHQATKEESVPVGPSWLPQPERNTLEVLGVGRLIKQKGFDLLIRALSSIKDIPWRLTILGEGSERKALEEMADALGVADRIALPGFLQNPYRWMAEADLFVLSSRWEGFGHVVAEAMASGVPVLATRCPSGPDEIIHDGVDGRLCEPNSADDLARALKDILADPGMRATFSMNARESVIRFDTVTIVSQYEALFLEATAAV